MTDRTFRTFEVVNSRILSRLRLFLVVIEPLVRLITTVDEVLRRMGWYQRLPSKRALSAMKGLAMSRTRGRDLPILELRRCDLDFMSRKKWKTILRQTVMKRGMFQNSELSPAEWPTAEVMARFLFV